jgi:predicted O-methyltransferase YrrM
MLRYLCIRIIEQSDQRFYLFIIHHHFNTNLTFFLHKSFRYFCAMINLQPVRSYIHHIIKAKTRHGIHSPFVYHLVDEVIYDAKPREIYRGIEQLRRELLKDDRTITITDLGAGSHVNNNRKKRVRQIAKNALKPAKLAQLIHRLAAEFKPQNILELGTCLGITTAYLAKAGTSSSVITIEGCPETASVAAENFKKLGIQNVELVTGNFDIVLPQLTGKQKFLDFVFVDGNHRKDATLNYFNICLPLLHEGSVMIFDDIYWSSDMKDAWEQIKADPRVTVTVDLFWIGLVFFRRGQAKEHFRVKF